MSHYDYTIGRHIQAQGYPFYGIIQAAMRQADTDNLDKLREAFPDVWAELQMWYHTPHALFSGAEGEEV